MSSSTRLSFAVLMLGLAACAVPQVATVQPKAFEPTDLEISRAPFSQVFANWKQRIDQPYVYVDVTGSYARTGEALGRAHGMLLEQGIEPSGPPFALFYDDPGQVPVESLRARACFPVDLAITPKAELRFDVLESTTVVYAYVSGPYPEVPRSYPGLFEYMRGLGWQENGPIRETYLVDPGLVSSWDQLVTEVQIPAATR
jgi:effector-binding domain-containing protein